MATNKDIVSTASDFIGKLTYVFGGDNIAGGQGDCSDFTQYVYSVHGYHIGYDTQSQYLNGVPVLREHVKAGDLVFFKNTYNSGKVDGVSHVGIAIDNERFIHLSNDGCMISKLSETYWKNHYLDARRVQGVTYIDFHNDRDENDSSSSNLENTNLVWWGDIVKVTLLIILSITGIGLLATAVGINISNTVGGVKSWVQNEN